MKLKIGSRPGEAHVSRPTGQPNASDASNGVSSTSSPGAPVQAFRVRSNVYATQFHPELDLDGIILRIHAYATYGYFSPDEVDEVIAAVQRHPVSEPSRMLRNFVELHAR